MIKFFISIFIFFLVEVSLFSESSNISDQIKILEEYQFQIEAQMWQDDRFNQQSQLQQMNDPNKIQDLKKELESINLQLSEFRNLYYIDLFSSCMIVVSYYSRGSGEMAKDISNRILAYSNSEKVLLEVNQMVQRDEYVISFSSMSLYETALELSRFLNSINSSYNFMMDYNANRSNKIIVQLP